MAVQLESVTRAENGTPTMSSLVTGIISDTQKLLRQEVALAKQEFKEEIDKARNAAVSMAVGAGLAAVGGILFSVMCVQLIALVLPLTATPLWRVCSCWAG